MKKPPLKFGNAPHLPRENHKLSKATRTQKPHITQSGTKKVHISTSYNNVPSLPSSLTQVSFLSFSPFQSSERFGLTLSSTWIANLRLLHLNSSRRLRRSSRPRPLRRRRHSSTRATPSSTNRTRRRPRRLWSSMCRSLRRSSG